MYVLCRALAAAQPLPSASPPPFASPDLGQPTAGQASSPKPSPSPHTTSTGSVYLGSTPSLPLSPQPLLRLPSPAATPPTASQVAVTQPSAAVAAAPATAPAAATPPGQQPQQQPVPVVGASSAYNDFTTGFVGYIASEIPRYNTPKVPNEAPPLPAQYKGDVEYVASLRRGAYPDLVKNRPAQFTPQATDALQNGQSAACHLDRHMQGT